LIIKEYPTSGAHVGHFKSLLNELQLKRQFTPDIIIVDYLNICVSSRLKGNSGANSYTIIKSIAEGLKYLHDNDIIHRDLKPANILLDNKTDPKKAIIIDFGVSTILNDNKTDLAKTKIGTPYFMSPEQVEINKKYNSKCDIWALGCILYELVTLDKPFRAANIQSLNIKIIKSDYKPIVNTFNDPDIELFKKIINMCLIKSEDLRASIDNILEISEIKKKVDNIDNKKIIQAMPCEASFNKVKIFTKCAPVLINKNFYTKTDIINYVTTYLVYTQPCFID
jgi:serine/threonine protein kinase